MFWSCIAKHFTSAMNNTTRTVVSIKSRWQTLQHAINKFCGCVHQINLSNQSGTNAEDQLSAAFKLYAATNPKPFNYLQCYNILSQAPKWVKHCSKLDKKKTKPPKNRNIIDVDSSLLEPQSLLPSSDIIDGSTSDASTIQSNQTNQRSN
jgi:hypothetical protein